MEHFEKTKLVKYCEYDGCKEPLKSIMIVDEDTDQKIGMSLFMAFAELREAKMKCRHGEPEEFIPVAPFRVIGVDTFSNDGPCELGSFKTLKKALAVVKEKGGTMFKTHAYDAKGRHVGEGGTF